MADPAARAHAEAIDARRRALLAGLESRGGGTDPAYAPEREHFGAYTHQEIWELVREVLDPTALGRLAAAWRTGADTLAEAFQTFSDAVNREFPQWSGRAAAAAEQTTREFIAAGTEASDACRAIHRLMELNCDAAQTIRDAIPAPRHYLPLADPVAETALGGQRRMAHDIEAAAAQADAQDTMTYVYTPTMPASGDQVPRFAPPPGRHPESGGGSGAR